MITLGLNVWTVRQTARAVSNVPWRDQWWFIGELAAYLAGGSWWPTLWNVYWGHRCVLTRLIFLADAKLFALANSPLVALIFALQALEAGLFIFVARLLGTGRSVKMILVAAVTMHLMFSSLQMENFVWGFQVHCSMVHLFAALAFLSLVQCRRVVATKASGWGLAAVGSALLSSYSMVNGLITWPLLVLQAFVLRLPKKLILVLGLIGTGVVGTYLITYKRPPQFGMGFAGFLTRPHLGIALTGMVLGGPWSVVSLRWGTVAGLVGIAVALHLLLRVFRANSPGQPAAGFFAMVMLFHLLTAVSVVIGRISPEWLASLHGTDPLPSRYYTSSFLFWVALFVLALGSLPSCRWGWIPVAAVSPVILALTFGTVRWQVREAQNWVQYYHEMDAAASAFLVGVSDQLLLERVYPAENQRTHLVEVLKRYRLSVFAEPRAEWLGRTLAEAFGSRPLSTCAGAVDNIETLPDIRYTRLSGWIDWRRRSVPHDIVLTDARERIVGVGRSGLKRPDLASQLAPDAASNAGWLGYGESTPASELRIYGVDARQNLCQVPVP